MAKSVSNHALFCGSKHIDVVVFASGSCSSKTARLRMNPYAGGYSHSFVRCYSEFLIIFFPTCSKLLHTSTTVLSAMLPRLVASSSKY